MKLTNGPESFAQPKSNRSDQKLACTFRGFSFTDFAADVADGSKGEELTLSKCRPLYTRKRPNSGRGDTSPSGPFSSESAGFVSLLTSALPRKRTFRDGTGIKRHAGAD